MSPLGRKTALAVIGGVLALSFAAFAVLLLRYDRGDDPHNEDTILAKALEAEAHDEPELAAEYWHRLVALNPFKAEYARRHYHALVRLRDFQALAAYTNKMPVSAEFTAEENAIEHLIAQGVELAAANSNALAIASFIEATNLNYYAATPYLINCQARAGFLSDAIDTAREYIKRFPKPLIVMRTAEWLALANRPDLIDETHQTIAAATGSYEGLVIDYYCVALAAWVRGDKPALANALDKLGFDTVKSPVARIMALEAAADGDDPKKVSGAFHALFSSPKMLDFQERGRRAVKRFVANHFPDKLPIHELGRLSDLVLTHGEDDVELLRVSLLAKQVDGTLHEYMISRAEHLYPDDKGIKAIREGYEFSKRPKE